MEALDVVGVGGEHVGPTVRIELSATDDLDGASRGAQEGHEGIGQSSRCVAYGDGLVVASQTVDLQNNEAVVGFHHALALLVLIFSSETDAGKTEGEVDVALYCAIIEIGDANQVEHLTEATHMSGHLTVANHGCEVVETNALDGLLLAMGLQQGDLDHR